MAKQKTSYVCQECGYDSPAFMGKCPECGNWNSFKEIKLGPSTPSRSSAFIATTSTQAPQKLKEIAYSKTSRIRTPFNELNTVLGGGFVAGSVTLMAGDPGIGKSTLLLQLCLGLANLGKKILYVSGEESAEQIKMRADRVIEGNKKEDLSKAE